MGKTFFIADTHFGDGKIIQLEGRPFVSVNSEIDTIISNWNSVVMPDDEVYLLGDVGDCIYNGQSVLNELNGNIYLVMGNHDTLSVDDYLHFGFKRVYDKPIIVDDFWICSHEPKYVNRNFPYANIFGHVHNNPIYKTSSSMHYCVSVERINYTPISFDEIKKVLNQEEKKERR